MKRFEIITEADARALTPGEAVDRGPGGRPYAWDDVSDRDEPGTTAGDGLQMGLTRRMTRVTCRVRAVWQLARLCRGDRVRWSLDIGNRRPVHADHRQSRWGLPWFPRPGARGYGDREEDEGDAGALHRAEDTRGLESGSRAVGLALRTSARDDRSTRADGAPRPASGCRRRSGERPARSSGDRPRCRGGRRRPRRRRQAVGPDVSRPGHWRGELGNGHRPSFDRAVPLGYRANPRVRHKRLGSGARNRHRRLLLGPGLAPVLDPARLRAAGALVVAHQALDPHHRRKPGAAGGWTRSPRRRARPIHRYRPSR